ncbi:MAG TPA: heavy metal-binding domain-containing protein [Streptosporangiaceae bacterium]|nr:heavy metal-binding domain-containing protein [Streptosporangiaceae bacterium]
MPSDRNLPPAAQARISEIKASGTWSSALSTAEFAAIRSVGFEPVGQVLGAAVYFIGWPGDDECPTYGSRSEAYPGRQNRAVYTVVSGSGSAAASGPLVNALYEARRRALGRMSAECAALGGQGIVGVSLVRGDFPGGGYEFRAIGTAVRAKGNIRLPAPFTSDLSGQEFAQLIMSGWVPVSLVLGISIGVRHDDWFTRGQVSTAKWNTEVSGYTELVNRTRQDARNELMLDVSRVNALGVVIKDSDLVIGEQDCKGSGQVGRRDHRAELTMTGTAITNFSSAQGGRRPRTFPVLSLDPERRLGARASFGRHEHDQSQHLLAPEAQDNEQDGDSTEEQ